VAAEMGLHEDQFLDMTPRQFFAWMRGYNRRFEEQAELIRASTFLISGPHMKNGTTITKFWPLPWDKKPVIIPQSKEQRDAFRERAKRIFKERHGNHSGT
jgi:hypothetical protein